MRTELNQIISTNEQILYEGKPDKRCYLFETIFNPLLPIAVVWAIMDFGIMGKSLFNGIGGHHYL